MGPRRILFCLAALCWLVTGPVFAQEQVLGLRLGVHPDKTRIVLDLSGELPYSLFSLADPYRVVIDMPAVEWATGTGSAGAGESYPDAGLLRDIVSDCFGTTIHAWFWI